MPSRVGWAKRPKTSRKSTESSFSSLPLYLAYYAHLINLEVAASRPIIYPSQVSATIYDAVFADSASALHTRDCHRLLSHPACKIRANLEWKLDNSSKKAEIYKYQDIFTLNSWNSWHQQNGVKYNSPSTSNDTYLIQKFRYSQERFVAFVRNYVRKKDLSSSS